MRILRKVIASSNHCHAGLHFFRNLRSDNGLLYTLFQWGISSGARLMRIRLSPAIVLALCSGCSQKPTADQAAASGKNVTVICRAILDYEAINKALPLRYTKTRDGKPGLSWRVTILPMLGERELYTQFHLDEPWDSPGNKALITKMPGVYKSPMGRAAEGFTNYLAIATPTSAWSDDKPLHIRNIIDGAT